jgi:hypothetical protein
MDIHRHTDTHIVLFNYSCNCNIHNTNPNFITFSTLVLGSKVPQSLFPCGENIDAENFELEKEIKEYN